MRKLGVCISLSLIVLFSVGIVSAHWYCDAEPAVDEENRLVTTFSVDNTGGDSVLLTINAEMCKDDKYFYVYDSVWGFGVEDTVCNSKFDNGDCGVTVGIGRKCALHYWGEWTYHPPAFPWPSGEYSLDGSAEGVSLTEVADDSCDSEIMFKVTRVITLSETEFNDLEGFSVGLKAYYGKGNIKTFPSKYQSFIDVPVCGDGTPDTGETCANCPADLGACLPPVDCADDETIMRLASLEDSPGAVWDYVGVGGDVCPDPVGTGYYGMYYDHDYDGVEFGPPGGGDAGANIDPGHSPFEYTWWDGTPGIEGVDDDLQFPYLSSFPSGFPQQLYFAAHWRALITVDETKEHKFTLRSDDDSWLYIDLDQDGEIEHPAEMVADAGGVHSAVDVKGSVNLIAGEEYIFEMYYAERQPDAGNLIFSWDSPEKFITKPLQPCTQVGNSYDYEICSPQGEMVADSVGGLHSTNPVLWLSADSGSLASITPDANYNIPVYFGSQLDCSVIDSGSCGGDVVLSLSDTVDALMSKEEDADYDYEVCCGQTVGAGRAYWADCDGNEIISSEVCDTVKLIVEGPGEDEGISVDYTVTETGAAVTSVTGSVVNGDAVGVWEITSSDYATTAGHDNYVFDALTRQSPDLAIAETCTDEPMVLEILQPICGDDLVKGETKTIIVSVSDLDDIVIGNLTIFDNDGKEIGSFGDITNGVSTFDYTFGAAGNIKLVLTGTNTRGKIKSAVSNIMVVDEDAVASEVYVAACIDSPRDYQGFKEGKILFDATSTRAIEYDPNRDAGDKLHEIAGWGVMWDDPDDDPDLGTSAGDWSKLLFTWTFSAKDADGNNLVRSYSNGCDSISYLFEMIFVSAGDNWVGLDVELKNGWENSDCSS